MPKISQLSNDSTPTLAGNIPLVDGGSTKAVTLTELAAAIANSITPTAMITPFGGAVAPSGWLLCQGQAVSRTIYAALFAAISTTYGTGDGSTTFNVPDATGRVLVGKNSSTFATLGAKGGEETHTLTQAEMPSHSHSFDGAHNTLITGSGYSHVNGNGPWNFSIMEASSGTQSTGSGGAHNNIQPYQVTNYIIKT